MLVGAALGGTAAGLSDYPDTQRDFALSAVITGGVGTLALATGLYLRATSPGEPPDAISLDPVRRRHRAERRVGFALAGLGSIAVAVGVAHAVGSVHDGGLADAQCPGGTCNADGERLRARAHTLALAAEMLIGPGLVGALGGIVMYRAAPDRAQVAPMVGPGEVGAMVMGRF